MSKIIAIGDIHGCSKTFEMLLRDKIKINKSDKIYCLGDYIDRGPDSKGVIDIILDLRKKGFHIHTLRGNHEQMMLISGESEKRWEHWIRNGGEATLKSFRIHSLNEMEPKYLQFFRRTKYIIRNKKFVFVHAGLDFSLPHPFEDKNSMLWIRNFEVPKNKLQGQLLIHGHTPKTLKEISEQNFISPFDIDGGCVYKSKAGMGFLVAFDATNQKIIAQENIDKYDSKLIN